MRKQQGIHNNEHQHDRDLGGIDQDFGHLLEANVAVDEDRDEKGIDRRYRGRFGRGEQAAINAAQNNDNQQQAPDGITAGHRHFAQRRTWLAWIVFDARDDIDGDHEQQAKAQAGDHAGHEQGADRGFGGGAIHDHDDGRWYQYAQYAGVAHDPGGERQGIA